MAPSLEVVEQVVNNDPITALKAANDLVRSGIKVESPEKHELILKVFRAFIADLCQQFNGGHPGSAMGMAAIGIALYKYVMKFSPSNCDYFNRDRFVLSNGMSTIFRVTRYGRVSC